jgi:hypothetical protein
MRARAAAAIHRSTLTEIGKKDLVTLAKFYEPNASAVTFYFGRTNAPDKAHHQEAINLKNLIHSAKTKVDAGPERDLILSDLEALHALAGEALFGPSHFRAVFASAGEQIWQDIELPVAMPASVLHIGHRFLLAPLVRALQVVAPYCVVLLETGKARAFVCRGAEIQELVGSLSNEDLKLHAEDSRVGWSSHIEKNQDAHEQSYFKKLCYEIRDTLDKHGIDKLIVGCREDLWGEIEPEFDHQLKRNVIGRFHLRSFGMSAPEVLDFASPILSDSRKQRVGAVLKEINDLPSRGVFGVQDSCNALLAGRARTLILDGSTGESLFECVACKKMNCLATDKCIVCGGRLCSLPAEEGLIRAALLTDAEVLAGDGEGHPACIGAAALLRY